jgi:predicted exporter
MTGKDRIVVILSALFLTGMGFYVREKIQLATGLADLLVESTGRELAGISARLVDSPLLRTMTLSVSGPALDDAIEAVDHWSEKLASHPEVEEVRLGPNPDLARAVHDLYFPRRLAFASSRPEAELPERTSDEGLLRAARRLKRILAGPQGPMVKDLASADPLLLFLDHIERLQSSLGGRLIVESGHFVAADRKSALVFLTTRHSAFDADHQAPLETFLLDSFDELRKNRSAALRLERAGVHRFAVASELRAREDMQRISMLSAGAIVALFLIAFGSLRLLLLALVPPVAGLLLALTLGLAWFGQLHVVTLVFGSTLIGVCIDYPIHYLNHHRNAGPRADPSQSLADIRGALGLGAVTSAIGFCGLAASGVPGIREMGAFAAIGVLGALAATCWTLPPLLRGHAVGGMSRSRILGRLSRLFQTSSRRARFVLGGVTLFAVTGLFQIEWQDDVFALDLPSDEAWLSEDGRVSSSALRMDVGRFVAVRANDWETALRRNDAVHERLEEARGRGELEAFLSLHPFLPSIELQERTAALLRRLLTPDRVRSIYEGEGFRAEGIEPFFEALKAPVSPLRYQDVLDTPLAAAITPFVMEVDDEFVILTFLRGPSSATALETALEGLEGTSYFDQRSVLTQLYRDYRKESMVLVGVGLLGVIVLLYARHRDVRRTVALLVPALLAGTGTLGLLGWLGVPVNLLHLLGLLLVLSIGVDYSIFLDAGEGSESARASAGSSILVAAGSTSVAFGLLCLSSHPVLRSLGSAVCVGVLLSMALTFLSAAASRGQRPRP